MQLSQYLSHITHAHTTNTSLSLLVKVLSSTAHSSGQGLHAHAGKPSLTPSPSPVLPHHSQSCFLESFMTPSSCEDPPSLARLGAEGMSPGCTLLDGHPVGPPTLYSGSHTTFLGPTGEELLQFNLLTGPQITVPQVPPTFLSFQRTFLSPSKNKHTHCLFSCKEKQIDVAVALRIFE